MRACDREPRQRTSRGAQATRKQPRLAGGVTRTSPANRHPPLAGQRRFRGGSSMGPRVAAPYDPLVLDSGASPVSLARVRTRPLLIASETAGEAPARARRRRHRGIARSVVVVAPSTTSTVADAVYCPGRRLSSCWPSRPVYVSATTAPPEPSAETSAPGAGWPISASVRVPATSAQSATSGSSVESSATQLATAGQPDEEQQNTQRYRARRRRGPAHRRPKLRSRGDRQASGARARGVGQVKGRAATAGRPAWSESSTRGARRDPVRKVRRYRHGHLRTRRGACP